MGWFSSDSDQGQCYQQIQSDGNKVELSHELLAGAASFVAAQEYEKHCAQNGQPASHAEAKELMAGFAGAFIDREAETRGADWIDREKAKRQAQDQYQDPLANDYNQ